MKSTIPWKALAGCTLVLIFALCAGSGCGETVYDDVYLDHPVEFDDDGSEIVVGEKFMTMGIFEEQLFREIEEGDDVPIIHGFQGGTWIHLSLRIGGMPPDGRVTVELGDLGEISYGQRLARTPEGFLEVYDIPVPVRLPEDELELLYGQELDLKAEFSSGTDTVSSVLKVVVVEG